MDDPTAAAVDLHAAAEETQERLISEPGGLAEIIIGETQRVIAVNSAARRAGLPQEGQELTPDGPLARAAISLANALADEGRAAPASVRDETRDQYWMIHAELLSETPRVVRVFAIDASAAVHEDRRLLLRGLVHGLRNASFSLDALLTTVDPSSTEDVQQMVSYLRAPISWLQSLASGLGRMIEHAALQRRAIALGELIRLAIARVRAPRKPGRVTARLTPSLHELALDVDPDQLATALAAIIENAERHGPADLPIEVEARRLDDDEASIELAVRDRGETLPVSLMPAIWAPMYHGRSRGLGLGLTLARDVVRAHGGEVFAERPANGGTRVGMRLPLLT